jgi:hypothetical protein
MDTKMADFGNVSVHLCSGIFGGLESIQRGVLQSDTFHKFSVVFDR